MKLRLPRSFYNPISYAGAAIAIISTFMFVFLYVLSSISTIEKAYVGIVIFIVIPIFIVLGLLLIPVGMIRKIRIEKREGAEIALQFPVLDLNSPSHRNGTIIFALGTLVFLFLSALGSYEAYHFTESITFCGEICHSVMEPEYSAYQFSPHARVTCAECHVGSGANWWVRSKLSGTYQVYAVVANVYPKPIPTPIENLRPARETCEECHWPQKVYGKQQRRDIYFLPDEENTRWEINMLMNTGGGNPALGHSSGIHWHINPDVQIDYITTDEKRISIPRVIMVNKITGEETVYNSEAEPLDESAEFIERRTMDCIDCHNRPSHIYRDPSRFINIAMAANEIDAELPMIKQVAVQSCMQEYETTEQAMQSIEESIRSFYAENYPEIVQNNSENISKSIEGVKQAFSHNIFPEMRVRWEHYADHIGHMTSPGCYRCHDGMHVAENGNSISHDCSGCHQILSQGTEGEMQYSTSEESLEFEHPVDIGEDWKEIGCFECHAVPPI